MKFETSKQVIVLVEIDNEEIELKIDTSADTLMELTPYIDGSKQMNVYGAKEIGKLLFREHYDILLKLKIEDYVTLIRYAIDELSKIVNKIDIEQFTQKKFEVE